LAAKIIEAASVEVVAGNHDWWRLENAAHATLRSNAERRQLQDFVEKLPPTGSDDSRQGRGLLCHGRGENDMNGVTEDDYGYGLKKKTTTSCKRSCGCRNPAS